MNWRKQTGILLAALLALLALAACGGEATPAPTPAAVLTLATPAEAPAAAPTAAPAEAPTETAMPETAPEAATEATGATAMDAISDEDFALFQQVGQAATERMMTRLHEMCPEANDGRTFPLAEPDYNAKRPLDLSAFADALATFDPARGAELDALLAGKTIPELQTLLDSGELTSVELVTYYVDRIQRYDVDRLNSVIELNPQALADAAAADVARSEGKLLGPLHGIPVLFKDNIATGGGMHTTAGAFALKDWQPDRDAFLVQQLHAAGALIFGKANLSEWANYMDPCMPSGFSVVGGQTRNPHGAHEIYGSSSGSAASVAANLTTVAVGSETSGSMIQPARVAGIVGLRPSQGLISRDYVVPLGPHLDTTGPMARSVTDVALLLNVLQGVDENDAKTADAAALAGVDFTQYLSLDEARKVRVGVILPTQQVAGFVAAVKAAAEAQTGKAPTDDELAEIVAAMVLPPGGGDPTPAIAALAAQGIEVVTIDDSTLPWPDVDTAQPQLPYDFAAGVADFFAKVGEGAPITSLADVVALNNEDPANRAPYGQSFLEWSVADELTPEEFARVQATAAALGETWMRTILEQNDVDILVTGMKYASNAGAAGVPALTIPNGLDPNGRPQGIILSGPYLSDPQLIAVGYALEQALNGWVEPDLDATIAQIDAVAGK
jgi:amidase